MRVVHVVRQFHPSVGGLQEMVLRLALALQDQGCQSRIVTLNRAFEEMERELPPTDVVHGLEVTRVPFFGSRRYPVSSRLLSSLGDADLVHVHGIDFAFDALAATRRLHRRRIVASTHGGFFHTNFASGLKKAYFRTITRASAAAYERIYAVSHQDAEMFGSIVPRTRLKLIENGVDIGKFGGAATTGGPNRTMIYFGRISAPKRIETILPLLAALRRHDPRWRLVIAGREWDLSLDTIAAAAQAQSLAEAVHCVRSPSDPELRDLIAGCSFFASLSSFEGFGIAAVEALSAGLFPILSDIPPFRDFVARTGYGVLVDVAQLDDAATAIQAAAESYEAAYGVVRPALEHAADVFAWPSVAAAYAQDYRELLRAPPPG